MNKDQQVCPCGATLGGSNHKPEHPQCHGHQAWLSRQGLFKEPVMVVSVKIGNSKQAKQLTEALRSKLGWTNQQTIFATNLQTTVTVEVAKDYCSIPHVLNLIAEHMSDLKIGT